MRFLIELIFWAFIFAVVPSENVFLLAAICMIIGYSIIPKTQ